jgi:chromosome segregation ATPase
MRKEHLAKMSELSSLNSCLQQRNAQIMQELQESEQQLEEKKKECEQLDQLVIEKNVELKFLHEDLHEEKLKSVSLKEKLLELQRKVTAVTNSSYVHRSLETRMICLEKDHYDKLL